MQLTLGRLVSWSTEYHCLKPFFPSLSRFVWLQIRLHFFLIFSTNSETQNQRYQTHDTMTQQAVFTRFQAAPTLQKQKLSFWSVNITPFTFLWVNGMSLWQSIHQTATPNSTIFQKEEWKSFRKTRITVNDKDIVNAKEVGSVLVLAKMS